MINQHNENKKQLLADYGLPQFEKYNFGDIKLLVNDLIEDSKNNILFGECYELSDYYSISTVVSLSNASHLINNIVIEDKKIYGDVNFVNTPKGLIAMEMFNKKIGNFKTRAWHTNEKVNFISTLDFVIEFKNT